MAAPVLQSAYLGYSGAVLVCTFSNTLTIGTGTPTLSFNGGGAVSCPRWWVFGTVLFVRVPDANVPTDNSATVTTTIPAGVVTNGGNGNALITAAAVTNLTAVQSCATAPAGDTSLMPVGMNSPFPSYFNAVAIFANAAKTTGWTISGSADGLWDNASGAAPVVTDVNGLPQSVSGSRAYTETWLFRTVGTLWPTGDYLLRTQGAGNISVRNGSNNTTYTVVASGTSGGWNWARVNIPSTTNTGIVFRATPPITGFEFYLPGTFEPATGLPTTQYATQWTTGYEFTHNMRFMDFAGVNNSNLRDSADFKSPGFWTDAGLAFRRTGTVTATSVSSSVYLGSSGTCYLVTHNGTNDPFQTGQTMVFTTPNTTQIVERISATQFKVLASAPPSGLVTVDVTQYGKWESMCEVCNHYEQDLWVCIPALLTDEAVTEVATRIAAALGAGLRCRVEFSNEVWNGIFRQFTQCLGGGQVLGLAAPGSFDNVLKYYGLRSAQIHKLFLDAFTTAGRPQDLVKVLAYQAAAGGTGNSNTIRDQYLTYAVAQGYAFNAPDEWAIAPYFGYMINPGTGGAGTNGERERDFLMDGSNSQTPISPLAILDVAEWALKSSQATQGWIDSHVSGLAAWNLTNGADCKLICYEVSHHLDGADQGISGRSSADGPNYPGTNGTDGAGLVWSNQLLAANRHPQMSYLHFESMKRLRDAGCELYNFFTCCATWGRFGSWGAQSYFGQPIGPGTGADGGNNNRLNLFQEVGSEAVKLWALQEWDGITPPANTTLAVLLYMLTRSGGYWFGTDPTQLYKESFRWSPH